MTVKYCDLWHSHCSLNLLSVAFSVWSSDEPISLGRGGKGSGEVMGGEGSGKGGKEKSGGKGGNGRRQGEKERAGKAFRYATPCLQRSSA